MRTTIAGACLLASCLATPLRAADVALLASSATPGWRPAIEALARAAAGHTITEIDLKGDPAEAQRVVTGLKAKPGTLVVALGPLAAQTTHALAPELPLVFGMVQDPAHAGLLGVPNAMGVAFATPVRNQLAAFRSVNPRGVRVGVVHGEATQALVDEAHKAAGVVRLLVVARKVAAEKDVADALRALLRGGDQVDALWLPPDPLLLGDEMRRALLAETLRAGKPVYTFSPLIVAEGALVSNGPDPVSIGEQLAELLARAAAGERAGSSALLVPRAELAINRKVAEKLKLEIPATALAAASKVF